MSKRDQGASITSYIEGGYVAEAVRNYLCLLGWSPKDDREKLEIEDVVQRFELANVNRRNASFDLDKLTWLNSEYMKDVTGERFQTMGRAALARAGVDLPRYSAEYVSAALETCIGKLRVMSELPSYAAFYFKDEVAYNPEGAAKHFTAENRPRLEAVRAAFAGLETFDASAIEAALKSTAAELGGKVGLLVHPTRLAVTGENVGPSLYHLLEVLGKEKVLNRIDTALASTAFQK